MKITAAQAEEIRHKLGILADDQDLQADYGLTQEQADELYASIPASGGEWTIPTFGMEAVKGELADAAEVLRNAIAESARAHGAVGQMLAAHRLANSLDTLTGQE